MFSTLITTYNLVCFWKNFINIYRHIYIMYIFSSEYNFILIESFEIIPRKYLF